MAAFCGFGQNIHFNIWPKFRAVDIWPRLRAADFGAYILLHVLMKR